MIVALVRVGQRQRDSVASCCRAIFCAHFGVVVVACAVFDK